MNTNTEKKSPSNCYSEIVNVGVIGCGYWGPNLIRNFFQTPRYNLKYICDTNPTRLDNIHTIYPTVTLTSNFQDLLDDSRLDAIAIATPVATHYNLALQCIQHGKHVLVEKPLTNKTEQAKTIVNEAEKAGITLMVDHTFIYTPTVRKMKELITTGEIGDLLYFDSTRINLGIVQSDVNVLWDLAVHDLSILQYLFDEKPKAVSATGSRSIQGRAETIAYLSLYYDSGLIAHCYANWMSPVKMRRTIVGGSKKMMLFDDVEATEKLKIYDCGVNLSNNPENDYKLMIDYRKGDITIPYLGNKEALRTEVEHFRNCILHKEKPLSGGKEGLDLVCMLEAASKSMYLKGQPIPL